MEPENPALDDYVRTLAPAREPRICLLPTAGGDSEDQIRRFHARVRRPALRADAHLAVPARVAPGAAARAPARAGRHLRRRRLDDQPARALARARARRDPARGVAGRDRARGLSAGSMCWFEWGVTKSVGRPTRARAGSASCRARTPSTTTASRSGGRSTSTRSRAATSPPGWGVDDGAGLLFRGTRLAEVVASRPGRARLPRARRRRRGGRGGDRAAAAQAPARRPDRAARGRGAAGAPRAASRLAGVALHGGGSARRSAGASARLRAAVRAAARPARARSGDLIPRNAGIDVRGAAPRAGRPGPRRARGAAPAAARTPRARRRAARAWLRTDGRAGSGRSPSPARPRPPPACPPRSGSRPPRRPPGPCRAAGRRS